MSTKIFVVSIPKINDNNGSIKWEDPRSNKKLNKTKLTKNVGTIMCAPVSVKAGGYLTGLHKPWLEKGVQKTNANGKLLTLQDYYEQKHNRPTGYYTNKQTDPMGNNFDESKNSFFEKKESTITLWDGTSVLDMDIPEHEIIYEYFLEHPFVANSEKEYRDHKWPKALFYISATNETEEIKYSRTAALTKAIAELHNSDFTLPLKRMVVTILDIANARTMLTEESIHNLLFDYINAPKTGLVSNIDKFMELLNMIKNPKGKAELEARYFLKKVMDYRIVYEKQGSYTWMRPTGPIVLGETYTETIDFLTNPKKLSIVDELKTELSLKE